MYVHRYRYVQMHVFVFRFYLAGTEKISFGSTVLPLAHDPCVLLSSNSFDTT